MEQNGNSKKSKTPQTIEELKQWYTDRHLPPEEKTRFFIGKDIREPRAFGIYKAENDRFVVYKNKNDGSRAVRYYGPDEAFAVSELLARLKQEVSSQKINSVQRSEPEKKKAKRKKNGIVAALIAAVLGFAILINRFEIKKGYYRYNDGTYYYENNDWFYYDPVYDVWNALSYVDSDLTSNFHDYYASPYYDESYGAQDFYDSEAYEVAREEWESEDDSDNDRDSDYDWDYGDDWDSGNTDFDSDW